MADERDDLIDEDQPLLSGAERKPVEIGIVYLLLVIAGICGVVGWLVLRYTHG